MAPIIRPATPADAEALLGIYAYYVRSTAISFEYEVPSLQEFRRRITETLERRYPYLCVLHSGKIVGYACAGPFADREAYDWSAEVTIYLAWNARRRGLGRKLYEALEKELKKMGIINLYARIGVPPVEDEYLTRNSMDFHTHLGYQVAGTFRRCGYKFERWYDMVWMEKCIGFHDSAPQPIRR